MTVTQISIGRFHHFHLARQLERLGMLDATLVASIQKIAIIVSPWKIRVTVLYILSHPTGNRNVRGVACGMVKMGMLAEFHLSIAARGANTYSRVRNLPGLRELKRGSIPRVYSHS